MAGNKNSKKAQSAVEPASDGMISPDLMTNFNNSGYVAHAWLRRQQSQWLAAYVEASNKNREVVPENRTGS